MYKHVHITYAHTYHNILYHVSRSPSLTHSLALSPLAAHTQMFGAGSGVDAFRRAVLCEPANTKAKIALKFAEEDSASKSEASINGIIKP